MIPVPTGRLAVVAALTAPLLIVLPGESWWRLVVVVAALVVVAVLDAALAPDPSSIVVERSLPSSVALGAEADLVWTVTNPGRRLASVAVADSPPPSLGAGVRRFTAVVPRGGRARVTTTIRPARRGLLAFGEVVVRVRGPLGLACRQRPRVLPGAVRVLPAFARRTDAAALLERARVPDAGLRSAQGRGGGTEFEQLRDYTPDDEFRRLDWAATARVGRPIVRTYRAERNQPVVVVLDTGRLMAGTVDGVPRIDHALDAALLLASVALRQADRVGLVAFDDQVRAVVAPGAGPGQLARLTDAVYRLQTRLVESDYVGGCTAASLRARRRSLLVVLTELSAAVVHEELAPAVAVLARRHLVIVAGVRDPVVASWRHGRVDGAEDAYRQAAAVASIERRSLAAARLREAGAVVLDEVPSLLPRRLAEAYLGAKASGRL